MKKRAIWNRKDGDQWISVERISPCSRFRIAYPCELPTSRADGFDLAEIPTCPNVEYRINDPQYTGYSGAVCGLWITFESDLDWILFG